MQCEEFRRIFGTGLYPWSDLKATKAQRKTFARHGKECIGCVNFLQDVAKSFATHIQNREGLQRIVGKAMTAFFTELKKEAK